jgi:CubicO group peptidase (beta-lactamase class C family)
MSEAKQAGLSAERLKRLDEVLRDRYLGAGDIPGAHIQVWRRGVLAHSSLLGAMDIDRKTALREDAIYRIYSMSKPITGVAVLMLAEEGKLDLDDDVAKHIPEWADLRVYAAGQRGDFKTLPQARPMKVVDLVTHTAGLTYPNTNATNVDAAYRALDIGLSTTEGGLATFVQQLAGVPLEFSPGTAWHYSMAMEVLGYLVEKISGLSFGEFLRTRIFAPLGIVDTGFYCPEDKLGRLVMPYVGSPDQPLVVDEDARTRFARKPKLESGGGGLVSTTADYIRFCRMLLGGGTLDGVQILSPKSVAMFSTNLLPGGREATEMFFRPVPGEDLNLGGCGYSVCCATTIDLGRRRMPGSLGEFFWSGAAMTNFWVDPKEDLTVVFMTQVRNSPHHFKIQRVLRQLVYGAFTEAND